MPRYIVERTFPDGFHLPVDADGAGARTFCVYDAPSPDAIRSVGAKDNVPVDAIHEVSVLDPYFYH